MKINRFEKYSKNELIYGALFFLFHLSIEAVSYMLLFLKFGTYVSMSIVFIYDFFAFVPQSIFGEIHNKNKKVNIGYIGIILFTVAILLINTQDNSIYLIAIILISLVNAIMHECGAIAVGSVSKSNIFPSALFVSGGAIGIVVGRFLAMNHISIYYVFIFIVFIFFILYFTENTWCKNDIKYIDINVVKNGFSPHLIFIIALFVLIIRSYMGFVLPLSWNKKFIHIVILSIFLCIGKALGGYFCDTIGYKKVSFASTILCVPFIVFGNFNMIISLIGIMLFSMNMSITYAMLLSIIKNNPGVAFGITTIGLFLGVLPLFFVNFSQFTNIVIIIVMSIISYILLDKTIKDDF